MMRAPVLAALLSCVPAPVVHAPVTVVVEPAPVSPCVEERVLVDDALQSLIVDAGGEHG